MIGASHHQNPIIGFQAIDLVEEVRAHAVGDDGVEIFEDEEAWSLFAGLVEDGGEGVFGPSVGGEGADVEGGDWRWEVVEGVHHCFDGDGLAVAF